MTYPDFRTDLQRIHESEVYGTAVFATAARLTRNPARKHKWLVLRALEEQTLSRYLAYMASAQQHVVEPRGWAARGCAEGAALALIPWGLAMKLVGDATVPFQATFLRLRDQAAGADLDFFTYVYAHEKAIEAFARMERARESGSLEAVERLLDPELSPVGPTSSDRGVAGPTVAGRM